MTFQNTMVILGDSPISSQMYSGGELDTGVTLVASTGTNGTSSGSSAGAYLISKDITFVTTTTSASAGNAAILPNNRGSAYVTLFNNSANNMYVFAPVGGTINNYASVGMATNTGATFAGSFQVGSNKSATFMTPNGTLWLAQHAG